MNHVRRGRWARLVILGLPVALLTACTSFALPTTRPHPTTTPTATATGKATTTFTLQVSSVADGDTFTGRNSAGKKVKVRMLSIDAPEEAHDGGAADCGSRAASTRLRKLIAGKAVTLVTDSRADASDQYGRRLVYVELDGTDIALLLIKEGLVGAWYPSGEPRPDRFNRYSAAETSAHTDQIGSWATCATLGRGMR